MVEIINGMLWSISPFGEAKVGIPYAILNGVNPVVAFLFCFIANVLVFPVMHFFLHFINKHLLGWRLYKIGAIKIAKRAKKGAGKNVLKYGFWGLLIFVMVPIPGTGVYAGTIAAYLFRIPKGRAFAANSIGIFFSCVIVWVATIAASGEVAL